MKGFHSIALALVLLAAPAQPRTRAIVLDGQFDDWTAETAGVRDPKDARGAAIDLREVRLAADRSAVYLLIDVGREVNLQGLDGVLSLIVDADGDASTGTTTAGVSGADFAIDFSPRRPDGSTGPGVGLRLLAEPSALVTPYDAGVSAMPSYASRLFEIRIERGRGLAGGPPIFYGSQWRGRLAFADASQRVRDETAIFSAVLPPPQASAVDGDDPQRASSISPLARNPEAFRIVGWNVSRRAIFERTDRFTDPLSALDADILALDEITGERGSSEMQPILDRIGPPGRAPWQMVFGEGGGLQRGVIASRSPLQLVPELQRVAYPPASLDALKQRFPSSDVARELIDAAKDGLAAVGASVVVHDRRLLVVTVDLRCCGRLGSFEDELRKVETETVRKAVRAARSRTRFDGVIVIGDFNLVGARSPLEALARGLDVNGSALRVAPALQLDGRTAATWRDTNPRVRGPIFTPSRLDYLLYGDAPLRLDRTFIFDTEDLTAGWLMTHHLRADDTREASDHLPLVADLRWK